MTAGNDDEPFTPRYLCIERGLLLGGSASNPAGLILVEQPDKRTWRRAFGRDLVELQERFPNLLHNWDPEIED